MVGVNVNRFVDNADSALTSAPAAYSDLLSLGAQCDT